MVKLLDEVYFILFYIISQYVRLLVRIFGKRLEINFVRSLNYIHGILSIVIAVLLTCLKFFPESWNYFIVALKSTIIFSFLARYK